MKRWAICSILLAAMAVCVPAGCTHSGRSRRADRVSAPNGGHGRVVQRRVESSSDERPDAPRAASDVNRPVRASTESLRTAESTGPLMLAAAGVAVRSDPATIDVDATVDGLARLGCNAYLYDIPHGTDAWAKLDRFATLAGERKIDVYVYLFPWTLAYRGTRDETNEPYGTDYLKWCDAIGTLAKRHPNVRGLVMDDFQVNTGGERGKTFTPTMVREMRATMQRHRPDLRFLPVLYFDLPTADLLESFGPTFGDGAIMCYPQSDREVEVAGRYLNDQPRGASLNVELPKKRKLKPGQGTFAGTTLDRDAARRVTSLQFFLDDQNATAQRGRHRVVVRVDGREVWSRVLAGASVATRVDVPLHRLDERDRVEIGIVADDPSEEAIVHISVDDVRFIDANGERVGAMLRWRDDLDDGIEFTVTQAATGEGRWHIPMTLLVAGVDFEHEKRFHEPGTPERIASRTRQAIDLARRGSANGVIAWYVPIAAGDRTGNAISEAFSWTAARPLK